MIGPSMTVEVWPNHWLTTIVPERNAVNTVASYGSTVRTWLIPNVGSYRLTQLKEDHVRALYRKIKDEGKNPRRTHTVLRRALNVAMQEGHLTRNVAANIDAPSTAVVHRTPLTLEQAKSVLYRLDDDPLAARWFAAILLGMRQGSASDFDGRMSISRRARSMSPTSSFVSRVWGWFSRQS